MHSKQGKKATIPHHLHTLQHKPHPSLIKKLKNRTIYKLLMFNYLPNCV